MAIRAICILIDREGRTIGARFDRDGRTIDLSTEQLKKYKGSKVENAIIDRNGLVRAKRGRLDKIVKEKVSTYMNTERTSIDIKCVNDTKYREAIELGVDVSNVAVCKKIRKLAKCGRLTIDRTEHRSGLNKHLFEYIEYCKMDVLEFIKQYMSNLQPYMIERRKDQEKVKSYICVIDKAYRVSVYIKVDNKQFEELVISFHEDNIRGVAKTNSLIRDSRKLVAIFSDCVLSKVSGENKYVVKVIAQRGMKELPLDVIAVKSDDIFIVDRAAIEQQFIDYCNQYIRDLYTSDLKIDFDKIEIFSMLQQISFTSYGRDTFSSISLLIDSICVQNDMVSKTTADSALVTFVQNLKLTVEQKEEILDLLEEKFKVTSIRGIDNILNRVRDNIAIGYTDE